MKKTARFLALFLSCVLSLSVFACKKDKKPVVLEDSSEEPTSAEPTSETPTSEEPKPIEMKTYQITEHLDKIKTHGRTAVLANGLACDFSASGIAFNAYIEGTLTLGLTAATSETGKSDTYFTLWVDGKKIEKRFYATASAETLDLATFETGGVHNIRLAKQTEARNSLAVLSTLKFKGYFGEKPANASHYIEFIGDSITSGYGNLTTDKNAAVAQTAVNQDATQAYAYLAAEALGTDCSLVSASGIGAVIGYRSFNMQQMYPAESYYRNEYKHAPAVAYTPARTPDLVVINLGTNDQSKKSSFATNFETEFKAGVSALVNQIRSKYNADIPIVWVYGMMLTNAEYTAFVDSVFAQLGGEAAGLYVCKISAANRDAGANHPSVAAHRSAAEELAAFVRSKNILQ